MNVANSRPVTITRQEGKRMPRPATTKNAAPIDPRVKSWIDNVIVPALVDEWIGSRGSRAAA